MKLAVKKQKSADIKELELVDNEDGTISVMLEDWSLVTFGLNDDEEVVFTRNGSIEDINIRTDGNGKIEEIEEGEFKKQ